MNEQSEIQHFLEQAKTFAKNRDYLATKTTAERVLAIDPENAEAYYLLGINAGLPAPKPGRSSLQNQEPYLRKAIDIDPSHIQARMALAWLYGNHGKEEMAIEEYTKVIEIDSSHTDAYERRGHLYRKNNQHDLAVADFSKAIEISPQNIGLHCSRGYAYLEQEKYEEAVVNLRQALSLDPSYSSTLQFALSIFEKNSDFLNLEEIDKIIEGYKLYIDNNKEPESTKNNQFEYLATLYGRLGHILFKKEQYEKSIERYKISIEYSREPSSKEPRDTPYFFPGGVHYLLATAYNKTGKHKEALVEFDKASHYPGRYSRRSRKIEEGRSESILGIIEVQEKDFQGQMEGFLDGPNSIFNLQDRFLERKEECNAHYHKISRQINYSLLVTFLIIVFGIVGIIFWLHASDFFSAESSPYSLLPYMGIVLLLAAVPVWWTRVLLKNRDRWQILQEDCFRKAAIMQYLKATANDEEFRNQVIRETLNHMANRGGADLLVAMHSDDPGSIFSVTEIAEKILPKKSGKG